MTLYGGAIWALLLVVVVIVMRRRRRGRSTRGRIGSAAVGTVYDLLNEDKRRAVEYIVEERTAEREQGHPDDLVDPEDAPEPHDPRV